MSTSAVEICNIALQRIGVGKVIASLSESSTEAAACNVYYDNARQRVLRDRRWPFATRREVGNLISESPNTRWSYSYRYPSDSMFVQSIEPVSGGVENPFEIGSDDTGRLVFTDVAEATLVYTADIEDAGLFDPLFASALSWLLASELATAHARKEAQRVNAVQEYQRALNAAAGQAYNEGWLKDAPDSKLVTVRD